MSNISIACVVVLYNPSKAMCRTFKSYCECFSLLLLLDNSDVSNKNLIEQIMNGVKNFRYIWFEENKGLSYALWYACKFADNRGIQYIMTIDQDSLILQRDIINMQNYITHNEIDVIAPEIIPYFGKYENIGLRKRTDQYTAIQTDFVITSGCIMNISSYKSVGGFNKSLFIEYIDTDICIKYKINGKKIVKLGGAFLYQRAGNSIEKKILWKTVHPLCASPERGYYLARNHIWLLRKYRFLFYRFAKPLLFTVIKMLLFEDRKIERIRLFFWGIHDGIRNKMGKLE